MRILSMLAGLVLAACSQNTPAIEVEGDWTVVESASSLSFDTIKNGDVLETHTISGITGFSDEFGTMRIEIDLDTVETNIDIRNERMREHLFETAQHPVAVVGAYYDIETLEALGTGESQTLPLIMNLTMRGVPIELHAEISVTRLTQDRVRVETAEPVMVHALALELMDGVDTLQELANLDSIERLVPVSFVVEFERTG